MGDHYVLCFAGALRFLWSQMLCRLYNSSLDETITQGPLYVYACKMSHVYMHLNDSKVHVRVWWIMKTPN